MSFETGGTCVLAWKKRDGLGGRLATIMAQQKTWEQRWIVLADGQMRYYSRGDEAKLGEADFEARGTIHLLKSKCSVQVTSSPSADAPTPNEVDIVSEEIPPKEHTQLPAGATAVAPGVANKNKPRHKPQIIRWKLCFDTQQDLMEFLAKAHDILEAHGQLEEKDAARFEHDFYPADHIYRWEMIVCPPVIYPIQIHGIVLEAGRNCVVVADFGLTGYGKKTHDDDFHHAQDNTTTQLDIMAQFKKLRPNSDQRLHITTLTDPMDIRKWTKAHYDETSFQRPDTLKKLTKITEMLGKMKLKHKTLSSRLHNDETTMPPPTTTTSSSLEQSSSSGNGVTMDGSSSNAAEDVSEHSLEHSMSQEELESKQKAVWEEYVKQRQEEHPLPKADPKDIVLSRANFLLEFGEERLPPYHVFFSNSECIAVWCKTGRWSTLQTAVFLSSNAIGGAKSATVATLGVAAAHAILAPVVAVGGLLWVSAPMVILKKSRERWEQNTMKMTQLYWSWAPPSVYVCAIEHWSEVGYSRAASIQQQQQQQQQLQTAALQDEKKTAVSNGGETADTSEEKKSNETTNKDEEAKDDSEQPSSQSNDENDALEDVGL